MEQSIKKTELKKRFKGWLALMMTVMMLVGSSMSVFAAEHRYDNQNDVNGITVGTTYHGGDKIMWHEDSGGGVVINVYIKGVRVSSTWDNGYTYKYVTLSGAESLVYTVAEIVDVGFDAGGETYNLYLEADVPVTRNLRYSTSENKVNGISVGDMISEGDSIEYIADYIYSGALYDVSLVIDGVTVDSSEWSGNNPYTYTFDKDVTVTGVAAEIRNSQEAWATITLASVGGTGASGNASANAERAFMEQMDYTNDLLKQASEAKPGDTLKVDATVWNSFSKYVLEELFSKEGVGYTFYYNYGGECFYVDVPQGAELEEGIDWYGPLKLNAMFGRTMIEKSELDAIASE